MRIVLNKPPCVSYPKEAYLSLMEEGYAFPIETRSNATVLLFKDVEDHTDGNGPAIVWMLEGEGTFFYQEEAIALKKGDAIFFDDRLEHGFEANGYCVAVSFDIGFTQACTQEFIRETIDAFEKRCHGHTEFSSQSPNF